MFDQKEPFHQTVGTRTRWVDILHRLTVVGMSSQYPEVTLMSRFRDWVLHVMSTGIRLKQVNQDGGLKETDGVRLCNPFSPLWPGTPTRACRVEEKGRGECGVHTTSGVARSLVRRKKTQYLTVYPKR